MKKNKKTMLFVGVAVFLCLIAVGIIVLMLNSNGRRLNRQLELGQKYLEEMDYEQAIVAFDEAIKIDPVNVEAYLGLADAYLGMDDYEQAAEVYAAAFVVMPDSEKMKDAVDKFYLDYAQKYIDSGDIERAISILEEGYKLTGTESLHNKAEKLRQEEEAKKEEAKREEKNSRWKNPRFEVNEETKEFISQMIDLCEQENYEEASNILADERFISKLYSYSAMINGISCGNTINTFCGEYSVYISAGMLQEGSIVDFVCIPEYGKGYIVRRTLGTDSTGNRWDMWGYLICPVVEYKLNGSFYSYYNDREGLFENFEEITEGELKDNYFDGEIYVKGDKESWSKLYDNGHPVSYGKEDGSIIITKVYDSNGEVKYQMHSEDFESVKKDQYIPVSPINRYNSCMYSKVAPWD